MSLLITSNTPESINQGYQQEGINKAFSYQNNLNDTYKVPANSEIAVQSVKINRSGNISINEDNSVYGFYFGEEIDIDVLERNNQLKVCSIAFQSSFGLDPNGYDYRTGLNNALSMDEDNMGTFTGNVDNIARMMKSSLNRALWHPNLMKNTNLTRNPGANVQPLRNGSGLDWLGWKIEITNSDETKNASHISSEWKGAQYNGTNDGIDYTYNPTTRILTAPGGNISSCVGIDYPLSLANGSFTASLVARSGVGIQRIGLCRALRDIPPNYFNDYDGNEFYDYKVEIDDDGDIFVEFAGTDGVTGELEMLELNYGARKNASTLLIDKITFNIQNERVSISIIDDKGVITKLCDGNAVDPNENVKPVSMTCRYLYPKIDLDPGHSVKIEEYFGVDIFNHEYYGFKTDTNQPVYTDWWANATLAPVFQVDLYNLAKIIDTEFEKNIYRDNQVALNANKQCDYKVQFFFAPDDNYWNTARCNSQFLMGFPNRSLVNVANTTAGTSPFTQTYQSDSAPEMKSTQSLFVRLKNFTHNSVNLAKGSNSKILYHVPAFSNTGQRVGALYFEPAERTYLKLNNPQDLYLSTIELDVVYSDEKLAEDLQGKTTIVLHIRDAKM
jgi:hypothetical protein